MTIIEINNILVKKLYKKNEKALRFSLIMNPTPEMEHMIMREFEKNEMEYHAENDVFLDVDVNQRTRTYKLEIEHNNKPLFTAVDLQELIFPRVFPYIKIELKSVWERGSNWALKKIVVE